MANVGTNLKKQGGGKAPPKSTNNSKTLGYLDLPRASETSASIYARGLDASENRFNPGNRLAPADEYYVMARNTMAMEDENTISKQATAAEPVFAGVDINMLSAVVGIPPIPDNVADPPAFNDIAALTGGVKAFESGRVGKEYTRRVLERGQFLTLTPLELKPDLGDATLMALGHVDPTGTVKKVFHNVESLVDRLSIGAYGYKTKIANKRYWRSVVAHMKVAMFSLGIDDLRGDPNLLQNYLAKYLPDFMVQFMVATSDLVDIRSNINSKTEEEENITEEFKKAVEAAEKDPGELSSGGGGSKGGGGAFGDVTEKVKSKISDTLTGSKKGKSGRGGKNKSGSAFVDKGLKVIGGYLRSKVDNFFSGDSSSQDAGNKEGDTRSSEAMYTDGFQYLLKHVANINMNDADAKTLPFTVFYVNGPIDRQMSFSLELQNSTISHASVTGGKKATSTVFSSISSAFSSDKKEGIGSVAGEVLGNIEPFANEWAYHSQGSYASSLLVSNIIVPKVMTGGSTDTTYTIPIREVTVSSDRFSLLRPAMAWALLAPYALQTTMPRKEIIIPTSALYCAAFSKGVINAPRAVITNLQIKTDTAFQTTFGAPTELDFTITLQPLYTISTTPDFNRYWGTGDLSTASALIGAMWNPMSSMNILATMCGQNTVLTGVPLALTEVFITGRINSAWSSIKGTYSNFRATLRDYRASFKLAKSNAKYI